MLVNIDSIFLQINISLTSIILEGIFFLQALTFIRKAGKVAFLPPSQQKVMPAHTAAWYFYLFFKVYQAAILPSRFF
jgi:hypothetical protein